MRNNLPYCLLCFSIILTVAACKKEGDNGKTVFRYNESAGITSLDPAFARNQANIWAVNQLFNGLVQLNDKLEAEACIAQSWEVRDNGLTYVFHLRKDVFFHDDPCFKDGRGRRVIADDFVYSFLRIIDPSIASPGAWVFSNADTNFPGGCFQAPDDSTLLIRMKEAFPPFIGILSMQYCSVIPHEAVARYREDFRKHPVGTGPFRFQYWKEGVKLIMLRNDHYFETDGTNNLPYLDAVAISFIVDKQSVFLEFIKGNLDFLSGIDASYKDELLTRQGSLNPAYAGKVVLQTQAYLNTEYLGFNLSEKSGMQDNPLLKKEIRLAVNHGFDRSKMMRYLRNNIGMPGIYGFIPPGLPSFDSSATYGYDYDPARARDLLAAAGYPQGAGLPPVTLSTNASYLDLATYIQQQLNELGFKILLDVHPPASMREMIAQGKLDFFRGSWIADYPDAENFLSLFVSHNHTPYGPNYTRYTNREFDRMYQEARLETDVSKRNTLYRKMDSLMMTDVPVVVLYYDQVLRFTGMQITNLGSNPMNLLSLKRVKKKKPA
ncbi:MAG TPA: ABC transporter substrate-binding protein [Bacteroidales bacterium]|nr:ABC transporter substrate-binding protein [Bacteroidales bacterium]HSA42697.1 ABC transporter substrate-binding protein [Bacteroidales bacterium]